MTAAGRPVVLLGLPVAVHHRAVEHSLTLRREMAVVKLSEDLEGASARLQELSAELGTPYAGFGSAADPVMAAALAAGDELVDVRYELPTEVVEVAEHLDRVLDEVDDHCRSGELVSLVTPPDVLAYRRWFLREIIAQVRDGAPPRPYEAPAAPAPADEVAPAAREVVVAVSEDLDLEGVGAAREAIAAALESGATVVVVDLAGCTFVDSVGVSLLLTTWGRLQDQGGRLVVANAGERVRTTLQVAGVLDVLQPV